LAETRSATTLELFVGVAPGLEDVLAGEIDALLPTARGRAVPGGVVLRATRADMEGLVTGLRTAEFLRVRLGSFRATDFRALRYGLTRLGWAAWFARDARVEVRAVCRKSRLIHSKAVEERAKEAIEDRLATGDGARQDGSTADTNTVHLRIVRDRVQVSIDPPGAARLHRRGYRLHVGKAPLRETLAAACLRLARPATDQLLWDPFCGSGTLVIEHALGLTPPAPSPGSNPAGPLVAVGSDIDPKEIEAALHNAERAGCAASIRLEAGDFEDIAAGIPSGSAILTNLPYGKRTGAGQGRRATLQRFGDLLRRRRDLGPVLILSADRDPSRTTGLRWDILARFSNRGLAVRLYRLERPGLE
jgi:putative N6-adenine-specific DNA methylase